MAAVAAQERSNTSTFQAVGSIAVGHGVSALDEAIGRSWVGPLESQKAAATRSWGRGPLKSGCYCIRVNRRHLCERYATARPLPCC